MAIAVFCIAVIGFAFVLKKSLNMIKLPYVGLIIQILQKIFLQYYKKPQEC